MEEEEGLRLKEVRVGVGGFGKKRERVRCRQKENEIVKKDRKRIIFLSL